jgi:hypothetical protein
MINLFTVNTKKKGLHCRPFFLVTAVTQGIKEQLLLKLYSSTTVILEESYWLPVNKILPE